MNALITLTTLRNYTNGYIDEQGISLMEVFNPDCTLDSFIDEAIDAKLQKYKLYFSAETEKAKALMKSAKSKLKKGDRMGSIKEAQEAKSILKDLLRESDKIDDDEFVIVLLESLIKTTIGVYVTYGISIFVTTGTVVGAFKAGKGFVDTLSAANSANFYTQLVGLILSSIWGSSNLFVWNMSNVQKVLKGRKQDYTKHDTSTPGKAFVNTLLHPSVSRTEAKNRYERMLKVCDDIIASAQNTP